MKRITRYTLLLMILILLCSGMLRAQTFTFESRETSQIRTAQQIKTHNGFEDTITVFQDKWTEIITAGSSWGNNLKFKSVHAFVKFYVNHSYPVKINDPYTLRLTYRLYGYRNPLNTSVFDVINDTLTISYKPDSLAAFQDMQYKKYSGYHKIMVVMTGLYSIPGAGGTPTPVDMSSSSPFNKLNFNVEGSIQVQPFHKRVLAGSSYADVYGPTAAVNVRAAAPLNDQLPIRWNLPGAVITNPLELTPANYELEWTWLDNYAVAADGTISALPADKLKYDFSNNSTRVSLDTNFYRIPLTYQRGYLVFRVRMVRPDSVYFRYPVYGAWSIPVSGKLSSIGSLSGYRLIPTHMNDSINWQYTVSFAEQGKYKHVMGYFDGLLKSRQSITRFNSQPNQLIATEQIYDYEGRPSISILPTPLNSPAFRYQYNLALNSATGFPYVPIDIDFLGSATCPDDPKLPPLSSSSGANRYYSHLNPDTGGMQRFVPHAGGFPLVQTIYSPGYDERVEKQGGAGDSLQIGYGHTVKNSYVGTEQMDLNRLFGLDIGWAGYYRKTVSRDPNGQYSLNITDYEGHTVTSSMIGIPDTVKHAIVANENVPGVTSFYEDFLAGTSQQIMGNQRVLDRLLFNEAAGNNTATYIYQLSPYPTFCPGKFLSVKAFFDYGIYDECGKVATSDTGTLGITGVVNSGAASADTASQNAFFMEQGKHSLHKELTINTDEINKAVEAFMVLRPEENCLKSEPWFIRQSVQSKQFPCPASYVDVDINSCAGKKYQMMQELWPNKDSAYVVRKYGVYHDNTGPVIGNSNSIFTLLCGSGPNPALWNTVITEDSIHLGEGSGKYTLNAGNNGFGPGPQFDGVIVNVRNDTLHCRYRYQDPCLVHLPDTLHRFGQVFSNLQSLPVDTFIMIFADTVAAALLPLHPEYCSLLDCVDDLFEQKLRAIPDFRVAKGLGLFRLSEMIAADPLYAQIQTQPVAYPVPFDTLSHSPGGILNLDSMALIQAWCNCNDSTMMVQCMTQIYATQINTGNLDNDLVAERYFTHIRNLYMANRRRYLFNLNPALGSMGSCSTCSHVRMRLVPPPVFTNMFTANGGLDMGPGSFFASVQSTSAAGASNLSTYYNAIQAADPDSLATFSALMDSAEQTYNNYNTSLCAGPVSQIIAHLVNCADSVTLLKVRDSLLSLCNNQQVAGGLYTPAQIRWALTINGITLDDLCNPYLVNYDNTMNPSQATEPGSVSCLSTAFYTHATTTLDTKLSGILQTNGSLSFTLDLGNQFEAAISAAMGGAVACTASVSFNAAQHLYLLRFTSGGPDTVRFFMRSGSQGVCANPFTPVFGYSMSITVDCMQNLVPGNFADGYIAMNFFGIRVRHINATETITCVLPSWSDKLKMSSEGSNEIAPFVPCTQMRSLFDEMMDTMAVYKVKGMGHPYYRTMMRNFLNHRLQKAYTDDQYLDFIQSCALADFRTIPRYTGFYYLTFTNGSFGQNFMNALNSLDPEIAITAQFRYKSVYGEAIVFDLKEVPKHKLRTAHNFIVAYTSGVTDKQVNLINTGSTFLGYLWVPDTSSFTPGAFIFGGGPDTLRFDLVPLTLEYWNGTAFQPYKLWTANAPYATSLPDVSYRLSVLQQYLYEHQVVQHFYPCMEHTVSDHYKLATKAGFLDYAYNYQPLPPNKVLDSLQTQFLQPGVTALNGMSLRYGHPAAPGNKHNLYVLDPSTAMDNTFYEKLRYITDNVRLFLTGNALFFSGSNTRTVINNSSEQLMAYRCRDRSFFYRYFGAGDSLFDVFLKPPAYLDLAQLATYRVSTIRVNPGEGHSRSFHVRMTSLSYPELPLELDGFTDFTVAHNQVLKNVLLTYAVNEPVPVADTVNNCERQLLNNAIDEGKVRYAAYIDSIRQQLRSGFLSYVLNTGVEEKLLVGYRNQRFNYTLYYYDRAGNLMRTVPPAGANMLPGSQLNAVNTERSNNAATPSLFPDHTKSSIYHYNSLNQVREQITPDAGRNEFFYDAAGRIIFSQNEKQRPQGFLSYILYDKQGRITETGEVKLACVPYFPPYPSANVQDSFPCSYYVNGQKTPFPPQVSNLPAYTHESIAAYVRSFARREVVYTHYDQEVLNLQNYTGMSRQENLRQRVSAIKYLDYLQPTDTPVANYNYAMHFSYDIAGNVKTLTRDYPVWRDVRQQFKRVDYDYDVISGKINLLSYNRSFADQYFQRYGYDDDNRITKVETSSDGYIWKRDADYQYYQHGPLARVSLGDLRVQAVDYAYTIQGWLKAINGDMLDTAKDMGRFVNGNNIHARDAVALTLDYFKGDYRPIGSKTVTQIAAPAKNMYNGNIPGANTAILPFPALHTGYIYDQLNRIIKAQYDNVNTASAALTSTADYYSKYTYDPDGNLQKLVRHGNSAGGISPLMDSLSYHYQPGQLNNRLKNVTDLIANPAFHTDIKQYTNTSATRYLYDATGNTIKDLVSGQDTIKWNHYNKVTETRNDTADNGLAFAYDGAGQRYLKTLNHTDGDTSWNQSDYYVRDAQGNILAVYNEENRYKMKRTEWIEYITRRYILATSLHSLLEVFLHPRFTQEGHFKTYLLQEIAKDPGYTLSAIAARPVSFYVSNSGAVKSNILAHSGDYADFYSAMGTYSTTKGTPLLGDALHSFLASEKSYNVSLLSSLLNTYVPGAPRRQVLKLLCTHEDTTMQVLMPQMGLTYDPESADINADLIFAAIATDNDRAFEFSDRVSKLVQGTGFNTRYLDFIRALCTDKQVLEEPQYTNKDTLGRMIYFFQPALDQFADNTTLGKFLDSWAPSRGLLKSTTADDALLGLVYDHDGPSFIEDFITTRRGGDLGIIHTALQRIPWLTPGSLLDCHCYAVGWTDSIVHTVWTNVMQSRHINLASHHIYGNNRLGTQDYLPAQYYLDWNNSGPTPIADTVRLNNRRPWYSMEYNDDILGLVQQPWLNTDLSNFYVQHLLGQKQYELTNHLGNVQATVSDNPFKRPIGELDTIRVRNPALVSAYDYYPFGMLMPGRYVSDTSAKCLTVTQTKWIPYWIDSCYWVTDLPVLPRYEWVTQGLTSYKVLDGLLQVDFAGSGQLARFALDVEVGVEQQLELDLESISGTIMLSLAENIGSTLISTSSIMLNSGGTGVKGIRTVTFTPSTNRLTLLLNPFSIGQLTLTRRVCIKKQIMKQENVLVDVCSKEKDRYRFGYNGQEKVNEWAGIGNYLDFGERGYDSRIARFTSIDPLTLGFPWYTPYQFAGNTPIQAIDLDGEEPRSAIVTTTDGKTKLNAITVSMFGRLFGRIYMRSVLAANIVINQEIHDRITKYKKGAITLGNDINYTSNYKANSGLRGFLALTAHEATHVKQFYMTFGSPTEGSEDYKKAIAIWMGLYGANVLNDGIEATASRVMFGTKWPSKNEMHDKLVIEIEANANGRTFEKFLETNDFMRRRKTKDGIKEIASNRVLNLIEAAQKAYDAGDMKRYKANSHKLMELVDNFKKEEEKSQSTPSSTPSSNGTGSSSTYQQNDDGSFKIMPNK